LALNLIRLIPFGSMASHPTPLRVLLVDDDAASREVISLLLDREGYAVESADSGDAALALLNARGHAPEIVLTDVQMPGTSGSQLADLLRVACGPACLLLAMSGSGPPSEAISRFDGFLMKPFAMQEIAAALSAWQNGGTAGTAPPAAGPAAEARPVEDPLAPLLDERIYRKLAASMPAQPLHQLYALCINDARERIAAMRRLAAECDAAQFVRQAHSIKGGCGMLGASELYRIAARIEAAGLDAPGLDAPGQLGAGLKSENVNPLDELASACDRLERILAARASASNPEPL
jgi:CheY-like chemotaxis protein/HPt (histidine-containing phosphotransfer) domain-containing protein